MTSETGKMLIEKITDLLHEANIYQGFSSSHPVINAYNTKHLQESDYAIRTLVISLKRFWYLQIVLYLNNCVSIELPYDLINAIVEFQSKKTSKNLNEKDIQNLELIMSASIEYRRLSIESYEKYKHSDIIISFDSDYFIGYTTLLLKLTIEGYRLAYNSNYYCDKVDLGVINSINSIILKCKGKKLRNGYVMRIINMIHDYQKKFVRIICGCIHYICYNNPNFVYDASLKTLQFILQNSLHQESLHEFTCKISDLTDNMKMLK